MPPYLGCEGGPGSGGTKEIKIFKEDVLNWFVKGNCINIGHMRQGRKNNNIWPLLMEGNYSMACLLVRSREPPGLWPITSRRPKG